MALNHRLKRLEANAPRPRGTCTFCGIEHLKDGAGPVYPGWVLPESAANPNEFITLGCKSCLAWIKVRHLPTPDASGAFHVAGATRCECPDYI